MSKPERIKIFEESGRCYYIDNTGLWWFYDDEHELFVWISIFYDKEEAEFINTAKRGHFFVDVTAEDIEDLFKGPDIFRLNSKALYERLCGEEETE